MTFLLHEVLSYVSHSYLVVPGEGRLSRVTGTSSTARGDFVCGSVSSYVLHIILRTTKTLDVDTSPFSFVPSRLPLQLDVTSGPCQNRLGLPQDLELVSTSEQDWTIGGVVVQ